jgi:DNA-binding MarR family transcriptional regulator
MTSLYDEALAPLGINLAQYSLMRNIQRRAPLSLTELGRTVDLDRSTVGRNIRILERMGLVKAMQAKDHREACIALSRKGERVMGESTPFWTQAQEKIERTLGIAGAHNLCSLLDAL